MGVRGLTTFLAKNSKKYMLDCELHDCYLVIDGNSLAVQLYQWQSNCLDCFGGDYDKYAQTVRIFFETLKKCGITPLVVFDGCFENKKLKTIYARIRSRVTSTKTLNASTYRSARVFPLFLRELFTELVLALECKAVRCEFEADYEMACLAKTMNCPLLSYDSDFYIFDVLYIPYPTLDSTPKVKRNPEGKLYHYLECKLYNIDKFLEFVGGLDKSVLPLLATVVGNDYIASSVFADFYAQMKMVKKKRLESEQQRKIESVIKWLLNETFDSAAKKILSRVKQIQRPKLAEQIKEVVNGYHCVESSLLSYFGIKLKKKDQEKTQFDLSSLQDIESPPPALADNLEQLEEQSVEEVAGELHLKSLKEHFPEWLLDQFKSSNFPAWFMDIAVRNRYFFTPQIENFDKVHSHTQSLKVLSALHKILRSGCQDQDSYATQLTYIAREGNNYIQNTLLPFCEVQVPTLIEIPGMTSKELIAQLHAILELGNDANLIEFLNTFDSEWKLFILCILYWSKTCEGVCKIHVYTLILCGITLRNVDKQIGYTRTIKDVNRKLKKYPDHRQHLYFIQEMIPYFYRDVKVSRNPKAYDVNIVDTFSRFQSVVFHIKHLNKLLLSPYEDLLISDFYDGTYIYNVFRTLYRREDPLSYLKQLCSQSMPIFDQFLQITTETICKIENIQQHTKARRKRKNKQKSSDSQPHKKQSNRNSTSNVSGKVSASQWESENSYAVLSNAE